jgi:hypothetical protein
VACKNLHSNQQLMALLKHSMGAAHSLPGITWMNTTNRHHRDPSVRTLEDRVLFGLGKQLHLDD